MKLLKKIAIAATATALAGSMAVAATACGGKGGENYDKIDGTVKIGVLVADDSGAEALAFKSYYENYIAQQYDVQFVYSAKLESPEAAKTQAETFIGQNCHAIIDMANQDRVGIAELCNDSKVYYAIASGMLSREVAEGETKSAWDICKTMHYYLGEVGPDNSTEYEVGKAMGEYYKTTKNVSKVGIYGAFIPNPMHVYRLAGILTGLGDTYNGKSGLEMVGDLFAGNGTVDESKIAGAVTVKYMGGYDPTTIYGTLGGIIAQNIDAFLSVGMTTTFFASVLNEANVPYADIDAFTAANAALMSEGKLEYLAGKYPSSIAPTVALILSAANGAAIRDNGNAVSVSNGFQVAKNSTEFAVYAGESSANPTYVYNKTLIDTMISTSEKEVTYETFKQIVEAH